MFSFKRRRSFTELFEFPEDMDIKTREVLLVCAKQARVWAEENVQRFECHDNLMGMCAIASGRLWMLLRQQGITSRLMLAELPNGTCHVFVEYNGAIVDVTATQFGKPEVVVIEMSGRSEWFWTASYVFKDVTTLRANQIETKWDPRQVAVEFEEVS